MFAFGGSLRSLLPEAVGPGENRAWVPHVQRVLLTVLSHVDSLRHVKSTMAEGAHRCSHFSPEVSGCQLQNASIFINKTHLHFQDIRGLLKCCLKCQPRFRNLWAFAQSPVLFTLSRSMSQKTRISLIF